MDLLTNKVFSKFTLSENFGIKLLSNGLEWELHGWKLIILRAFFVKQQIAWLYYSSETIQESSN